MSFPLRHCDHRVSLRTRLLRNGCDLAEYTDLDRPVMCGIVSRLRCPQCGAFICPDCMRAHQQSKHGMKP